MKKSETANAKLALFQERCKEYFPENYQEFLALCQEESTSGFFLNLKKGNKTDLLKEIDFSYQEYELNENCYYHNCDHIGRSIAYELGLIYPQEPSASVPISLLNLDNIKIAVDMCAAPGGKSCQLLSKISDEAHVICNDVSFVRAKSIVNNCERMGFDPYICSLETSFLASKLEESADLVILDAPCSGEGMIRKDSSILKDYSLANILACTKRQKSLLDDAYTIANNDSYILYCTCTYAKEENEENTAYFLNKYPDLSLVKEKKLSFLDASEGQYMALFYKGGKKKTLNFSYLKQSNISLPIKGNYYTYEYKQRYYVSKKPLYDYNLPMLRYGYLAKSENYEHALFRNNQLELDCLKKELNDEEYRKYIGGQELKTDLEDGLILLTYHGYNLGQGKVSKGRIKNKYPKGLRRLL